MMPVAGVTDQPEPVDYKKKYKALKRKLRFLVYEHESFLEELKKSQRKLLKVSRDRSFLLDRLMTHERTDDTSSDSDATASSDSEGDAPKEPGTSKKRKISGSAPVSIQPPPPPPPPQPPQPQDPASLITAIAYPPGVVKAAAAVPPPQTVQQVVSQRPVGGEPSKKRQKVTKKTTKSGATTTGRPTVAQALELQEQHLRQQLLQQQASSANVANLSEALQPGHMTREELERHLEYKQSTKPQFMSIDKAPNMLPDDIFNDESSNPESHGLTRQLIKDEVAAHLVIDLPLDA